MNENNQLPSTNDQLMTNDQLTNYQTEKIPQGKFDLEGRTTKFAKAIIRLCYKLPKNPINFELISQLVRSAGSVGANYREANDALSRKDLLHRLKITRKEAKESCHWLELILEANSGTKGETDLLIREAYELKKIFSSIIGKLE